MFECEFAKKLFSSSFNEYLICNITIQADLSVYNGNYYLWKRSTDEFSKEYHEKKRFELIEEKLKQLSVWHFGGMSKTLGSRISAIKPVVVTVLTIAEIIKEKSV